MKSIGLRDKMDTEYADDYCILLLFNNLTMIYQIMRAILSENGSVVDLFCVVKFTNGLVTHIAVDPVHGYVSTKFIVFFCLHCYWFHFVLTHKYSVLLTIVYTQVFLLE